MTPSRSALILVRNTVTHDARILREAGTLRRLGLNVLIAGVVSTAESEDELEIGGFPVMRLAPAAFLRSVLRRDGDRAGLVSEATPAAHPPAALRRSLGPALVARFAALFLRPRLRRVALTMAYYIQGIGLVLRTSPSLVHANDYNTMWIATAAKLLRHSKLVYDSHELWPDRNRRPEWRPWLVACEALFVRVADATITTSPGYAKALAQRYRIAPPVVVRNIPSRADRSHVRGSSSNSCSVTAVYVGGLIPGRGLESAIRALALAPNVRLRLVGPGTADYRRSLQRIAEEADVAKQVLFVPAVPPDALIDAIADADLGLMLIEPVCRSYELTLPNKLFEYAAAGLPVLSSDLPVIGPLVRDAGIGEVVPVADTGAVAEGMRRLADPAVNGKIRERVRAFAQSTTWEKERALLEHVYNSLLAPR